MQQLFFIILYIIVGFTMQALLFKTQSNTYLDALKTWPGLWVIYFLISHIIAEHLFRIILGKKKIAAAKNPEK